MAGYSRYPPVNPYVTEWLRQLKSNSNTTASNSTQPSPDPNVIKVIGFTSLVLFLLTLAALFAGLTLAICSLDMAWLHVLSTSGCKKKRNQYLVVAKIRRRTSWFLCSTIICSVACTESIPIILRELGFGQNWQPILLSTLAVAVFAELLPQYFIPRQALLWGYYCRHVIWGCMWITCVISWPLSILLDRIAGTFQDKAKFTTEQLAALVRYHERSEKHGGFVGPEAGRIARSALYLEGQTLRSHRTGLFNAHPEADIESEASKISDIIIPWNHVRYVNINDEVTNEFIQRIRKWAYSRLPVLGDGDEEDCDPDHQNLCWNGQRLCGFLHIKNLLGINLTGDKLPTQKLLVKDLILYPLPIVRDDIPIYDVLTLFQMGMSRMAVVIHAPNKDLIAPLSVSEKNTDALPRHNVPLWSAYSGLNNRHNVEMHAFDAHIDWTTDFLNAAQNNSEVPLHRRQSVIGIGCPKTVGIITYEDVLEILFQKTTYDEKDFFDRSVFIENNCRTGDASPAISTQSVLRTSRGISGHMQTSQGAFNIEGVNSGSLRRRNVSVPLGNDGANDISDDGLEESTCYIRIKDRLDLDRSTYTDNTAGGFHGENSSIGSVRSIIVSSLPDLNFFTTGALAYHQRNKLQPMRTSSSPAKLFAMHLSDEDVEQEPTPRTSCFETALPKLRRVTPFSHLSFLHEDTASVSTHDLGVHSCIAGPRPQLSLLTAKPGNIRQLDSPQDTSPLETEVTIPLCPTDGSDAETLAFEDVQPSSGQWGSQWSTSARSWKENTIPSRSTSLPYCKTGTLQHTVPRTYSIGPLHEREDSFQDDRALLPSQRKVQK